MAIRRHPKSPYWHFDFTVKGRRFRGSTETEKREIAKAIEAKLRSDVLLGKLTDSKPEMTLDIASGRYITDHASRKRSRDVIEWHIEAILQALGKPTKLQDITDGNLAVAISRWRGKLSDSSVNRRLTTLRSILVMARDRWGVEVRMPNWKAHWLLEPAPRDRYLSEDEAARLIAKCPTHLRQAVTFSLLTGVRLANCAGLDWSQVNMRGREITIRVKSKTPGGKPHTLPMSEAVLVLLANMGPMDKGAVFRYRGRPVKSFRRSWYTAMREAGIKDFRWHDLRGTAATWMLQNGVPLDVVKDVLGHEHLQTTMRYAYRETSAKRKAVDILGSTFNRTTDDDSVAINTEIPKLRR